MANIVVMPKLGLTMTEGAISSWLKKEGDAVKKGELIFEVETDKLTNTIESPADGILRKIIADVGETVPVLGKVAVIAESGEDISALLSESAAADPIAPAAAPSGASASEPHKAGERVIASPAAKKLAKELGIDLARISGTGPKGRIIEKDVATYQEAPAPVPTESGTKASPLATKLAADVGIDLREIPAHGRVLAQDIMAFLEDSREKSVEAREETVPMNGMRKAIAKNMLSSHMTSPTVTFNLGVDMTAMKAWHDQLKANKADVSYTDLLVKFVSRALIEYPLLNCSVVDNKIVYRHYVNMGVAVALPDGLVVPNVPDAEKKSLTQIHNEVKDMASKARSGLLPMEAMKGGTFTITNLGMYGIESFTPIINQPEVAILGANTMEDKVVVRNGEMLIRPIMSLSLTADHRVVDGSVAAEFLQRVKTLLENPALMLA